MKLRNRVRWLWFKIKRLFGWKPEWQRRIESYGFRPDVLLLDEQTYKDLLKLVDDDRECIAWMNKPTPYHGPIKPPPLIPIDPKKVKPE